MMKLLFKIFFLFQTVILFPQQITEIKVHTPEGAADVHAYLREGTIYISINDLSEKLLISHHIENAGERIILYGKNKDIRITAKNPFYAVINKKGKTEKVFQVPTTTYSTEGKIYIPFIYSVNILNEILNAGLEYDEQLKLITSDYIKKQTPEETSPIKSGYDVTSINIEEKANGTLVKLSSRKEIRFYNSTFEENILTVVLREVNADPLISSKTALAGLVNKIDVKNSGKDSELKFYVGTDYSASEIIKMEGGNNLLITLHNKVFTKENDKLKEKWDFDVIVLDPGHGGKDAGAIGINRIREKEINLAVALKLGRMIEEKMPGVKVEYTRKKDTFVELYKRGRIANENNGKLFISIHCNATADRSSRASGFEVYLLRPGRTQEAISIAETENSVIQYEDDPKRYQKLTDENFILVSMAQSAYMKYSEKFSEYLDKHFTDNFSLPSRGVKQAGFYVLVGASMPGVLIETGFLSNKNDAVFLSSAKGQQETAELIFNSIKSFKNYYETSLGTD